MKTALFKVTDGGADGDLVVVMYTTPRGGLSNASYIIKGERYPMAFDPVTGDPVKIEGAPAIPGDTPDDIVKGLAFSINRNGSEFCEGQFTAEAKGDMLVIGCSDLVSDITFISQVQGKGTAKIEQL